MTSWQTDPSLDNAEAPRWLSILGIGEDGVEGLSAAARFLLRNAVLVVGGTRHLALGAALIRGEVVAWPRPMANAFPIIRGRRPEPVVVLASGDPFCDGVGTMLTAAFPMAEILSIPAPSAYVLACSRLGWSLRDIATISFCGRPVEPLAVLLQPGRNILALSADETTPERINQFIVNRGFGESRLHVLEALGGPGERIRQFAAGERYGKLNMLAIEVAGGPSAQIIPLCTGLPDTMFEHDGQITKREIRAVTLSALAPRAGEVLWDAGCGSGSISIEWMLRHPANKAFGIERDPIRAARAARNALSLGVPGLQVIEGSAPNVFDQLPTPDAIFLGGGAHRPGVIEAAWRALRPGGRMVANGVVVETEAALFRARENFGGDLIRLSVDRLDKIGDLHGFRSAMTVTQWAVTKT